MDGWTDNRTHSMTTQFLKALHQQKPEPLSLQQAYLQWKLHNTWVPMYYINPQYLGTYVLQKPKRRVTSHTTIEAPRYPRQEGLETRLSLFWTITSLSSCRDQKR
eukprot:scaffold12369_cov121-Amphora_coffeaeformis.AAC.2